MKKAIAFLLAAVMVLSVMPVSALHIHAVDYGVADAGGEAKAPVPYGFADDIDSISWYRGDYGAPDGDFSTVGNVKITWDPDAHSKLDVTDGNMMDWANEGYDLSLITSRNLVTWLGTVPEEWRIYFYAVADADNLYFGFYVNDPTFTYGMSGGHYEGDAIQLTFDFGNLIGDMLQEDPDNVISPKNVFYSFSCNGDGAPLEIMRQESGNDRILTEEDGVYSSASQNEMGWVAEFCIPFDVLYYDRAWKTGFEEMIRVGGEDNSPLRIGACLYYIDRSSADGDINWAGGTTDGITFTDGVPAVSWTAYDNGIHLELDYLEGMEINCEGIEAEPRVPSPEAPFDRPLIDDLPECSQLYSIQGKYGCDDPADFRPVGTVKIQWDTRAAGNLDVADGVIDDWVDAGYRKVQVDENNMVSWCGSVSKNWSVDTYFVADSDNLYMAFDITDPDFAYGDPSKTYNGDAIQLGIDFGNLIRNQIERDFEDLTNTKTIFYSFSCDGDREPLRIMRQESDNDGYLEEWEGAVGSASKTENGWFAEFSIPFDTLYTDTEWKAWSEETVYFGADASDPLEIGFTLAYIDRSETGGYINWAAMTTNGVVNREGIPMIYWDPYHIGIKLELDYVEGMEINCNKIVVGAPETEPEPEPDPEPDPEPEPDPDGSYPYWTDATDVLYDVYLDSVYTEDGYVFTPDDIYDWHGMVQLDGGEAEWLTLVGTLTAMGNMGQFGYQIDNLPVVFDPSFLTDSAADGNETFGLFGIRMDISGLTGWHTARLVYQSNDGETVILSQFVLDIGTEADGSYENPFILNELPFTLNISGYHDLYFVFIPQENCEVRITCPEDFYVAFEGDYESIEVKEGDYLISMRAGERYLINPWSFYDIAGSYRFEYVGDLPHVHQYEVLVYPPTCTEIGFSVYMCQCGDIFHDDFIPELPHEPGEWVIDEDATCTAHGIRHTECVNCGTMLENVYVPPVGHSYVTTVIREATCTEAGIMEHTCSRCGDSYPTYVYSEHNYRLSEHVDASCETDGKNTYTCDRCGDSYYEIIPGAHSYAAEITKIATEEEEGIITYTCSLCGDSYTEIIPIRAAASILLIQDLMPWDHDDNILLLNHMKDMGYILGWDMTTTYSFNAEELARYSVVMIANDQTSVIYDHLATVHSALASFVSAGGVVIYGACDRGWNEGDITASLPGGVVKQNFYSRYNYIVDRLHPVVTGAMTDQRPLTDTLLYGNYCSHTYFLSDTLPENANIILRDANGNPTLVEYALGNGHIIASGLTWEFYYNRNAYGGGSLTYSKSVFDDLILYAVGLSDPCDHVFDVGTVCDPTCTEAGYTLHTCMQCGMTMKDTFIPADGHVMSDWIVVTPATTEQNGLKQKACDVCGDILAQEIIPKLNAPKAQVVAPTDTVMVGEEITFTVVIDGCDPVGAMAFNAEIDSAVFVCVDASWQIEAYMQGVNLVPPEGLATWNEKTDVNGTVFSITLKAIAPADITAVDFSVMVCIDGENIPIPVVAKNVTVENCSHLSVTYTEADRDYHVAVCDGCGYSEVKTHRYESACHDTCTDCGYVRVASHSPAHEMSCDGASHWYVCELCGVKLEQGNHTYTDAYDETCDACGYTRFVLGDLEGDSDVDSSDAVYLLYVIMFGTESYPTDQPLDFNRDGEANDDDALYLLYHSFFGESEYPLHSA